MFCTGKIVLRRTQERNEASPVKKGRTWEKKCFVMERDDEKQKNEIQWLISGKMSHSSFAGVFAHNCCVLFTWCDINHVNVLIIIYPWGDKSGEICVFFFPSCFLVLCWNVFFVWIISQRRSCEIVHADCSALPSCWVDVGVLKLGSRIQTWMDTWFWAVWFPAWSQPLASPGLPSL